MNERIKELARQADLQPYYDAQEAAIKKFAELIVRECATIAKETRWAVPPSQEQIAKGIRQYFGVEE